MAARGWAGGCGVAFGPTSCKGQPTASSAFLGLHGIHAHGIHAEVRTPMFAFPSHDDPPPVPLVSQTADEPALQAAAAPVIIETAVYMSRVERARMANAQKRG